MDRQVYKINNSVAWSGIEFYIFSILVDQYGQYYIYIIVAGAAATFLLYTRYNCNIPLIIVFKFCMVKDFVISPNKV